MLQDFRNASPQTRASAGAIKGDIFRNRNHRALIFNLNWLFDDSIVIPVVVGSSPISHPKEFSKIKRLAATEDCT